MTTAHRPTWHPTSGGKDQGGNRVVVPSRQYSSKDLPGHTTLKYRQPGQANEADSKQINYKQDLLQREKEYFEDKQKENSEESSDESKSEESQPDLKQIEEEKPKRSRSRSRSRSEDSDEANDEEYDSEESDFDDEEIKRELEKIKAERAEEARLRRENEEKATREKAKEEMLKKNPLMDTATGFDLKKKWTEETIFRNQTRNEPTPKQRFINDTMRSDFHKKILNRTIL